MKYAYTLLYIVAISFILATQHVYAHTIYLDATRLSVKDGFIWFATSNGMSRYDGYRFKNYSEFDNLGSPKNNSSISLIMKDEKKCFKNKYGVAPSKYGK